MILVSLGSCNVLVSSTAGMYKNTVNKKNVIDIFKVATGDYITFLRCPKRSSTD